MKETLTKLWEPLDDEERRDEIDSSSITRLAFHVHESVRLILRSDAAIFRKPGSAHSVCEIEVPPPENSHVHRVVTVMGLPKGKEIQMRIEVDGREIAPICFKFVGKGRFLKTNASRGKRRKEM